MKKNILLSLTISLTALMPLSVQAQVEKWSGEEIARKVGAMTWCTNNVAKNRSEASIYQSARRAGTMALEKAISDQKIGSDESFNILEEVESSGKYGEQQLNQELCKKIWQSFDDSTRI